MGTDAILKDQMSAIHANLDAVAGKSDYAMSWYFQFGWGNVVAQACAFG
jgi:hypothetical protein